MKPKEDVVYEVNFGGYELKLYPPTDMAIRWARLGAICLHYLDTEEGQLKNLWTTDFALPYLKQMGIRVFEASDDDMYQSEHEQYLETQTDFLDDKWLD